MYLLDTNVLSELRKWNRADTNVIAWFKDADPDVMFISPIVIAEIEMGVLAIERKGQQQGRLLRAWAEKINAEFQDRCIPIDREIARLFAKLQVPGRRPERDAWLAATALREGLMVVTRNTADFRLMDVPLINPWIAVD
jgi:toxin FitB